MTDTIKITTLSQMGATVPGPTLVPVVDMSGVPTTKKATIANIANAILSQAGNGYAYAAKANLANVAGSASTVSAAAQPNITSIGTLTTLAVSGAVTLSGATNLGPVGNVTITGGTAGQVLTTDGSNVLSWSTVGTSVAGSNTQVQFNDGGAFGATANLVFNKTTNNLTLAGNVIAQSGVYSNVISSIGSSNLQLWINNPSGFYFSFTSGGALQLPGGHVLETDGDGSFELKSGNGVVISSDIANTNQHFSFRTDGVFQAPSNVELEGTRLSIGPGAANVTLEGATVVVNANSNVYVQAALTNENANGSADWTAYGTDGDDMGGWTDFGFTGYNFNDANYTITGPGDGYLFAHAYANGAGGGNLVLATGDHGTANDIVFATNGFAEENEFGRISHANNSLELTRTGATITFPDSTEQSTAFTGNIAAANVTGLGNIATINLTGSTSNVLYGNGVFAPVTGGSANTGNVTFDDNIVIGTGDEYGGDGLFLATGPDGAANLQYLRLRGGDFPTHIHLDTGNNAFYDQYFGNDNKFVKLEAGDTGNVVVGTDDATGNLYNWTFTSDGNFILANGNSVIQSIANSSLDPLNPNVSTMVLTPDPGYSTQSLVLDPTAPGHIHLRAPGANIDEPGANIFLGGEESSFEVGYHNGSAPNLFIHSGGNTWTFDNSGNLNLPNNGNINANGGGITQVINEDLNIVVQDEEDDGWSLLNTITDSLGNNISQTTLDSSSFTIDLDMLGGDYRWQFDGNTLQVSNDSQIRSFGSNVVLQAMSSGSNTVASLQSVSNTNDPNIFTTIDATTTGANISVYDGGSNSGTGYTWQFANDGRLTFPGTPRIDTDANNFEVQAAEAISLEANTVVNIYTDAGNTTYQWQFGDDGTLTAPGDITVAGDITGTAGANTLILKAQPNTNTSIQLNSIVDSTIRIDANLEIITDSSNTSQSWTFGADGNLTLPGNLVYIGASPAPSISGFSSVSAEEFTNDTSNVTINANSNTWNFDSTGNLTIPSTSGGFIKTASNASIGIVAMDNGTNNPAQLLSMNVGNGNATSIVSAYSTNVAIQTNAAGAINTWSFDNAGNLTLPANTFAINYANGTQVSLSGSNIANGNSNVSIATANGNVTISAVGNTTMTVTGTGANVTGTLTSTGKIGYASGSTVTQITSRGTSVTINALAGTIVTTSAAMVATEIDTFAVLNSSVDPNNDIVLAQIVSPNQGTYDCVANPAVIGGFNDGFYINIVNISGFTTADETITIRFMVFKAPNA